MSSAIALGSAAVVMSCSLVAGSDRSRFGAAEGVDVLGDREGPFEVVVCGVDDEERVRGGVEGGDQVDQVDPVGLVDVGACLGGGVVLHGGKGARGQAAVTIAATQSSIAATVTVVS
jgi:hypothetical protein